RQARDAELLRRDAAVEIPPDFDFAAVGGLSNEIRQKLALVRPENLGQANRIEGMTPAALTAILAALRQSARASA
ncbi:MAG: tRNA uridine-5-carboxymethylaminomethyl(34) synthesis enzyme MnmG, partial [Tranquillimonas sp.]